MGKHENFLDPAKEALAVKGLRESLAAVDADDEALLLDTIEGETALFEIIDAVLERMTLNEALIEGVKAMVEKLDARRMRFETRLKSDRALIEQALSIAELPKLERPAATLSLAARPAGLTITEESDIPATYWKAGAPALDKKALTQALRDRAKALAALPEDPEERERALAEVPPEIPGATLSNGAPSLTIRRA